MKLFFYSSVLLGAVGIAFFGVLRRWVMKGGLVSPMLFLIFSNAAATLLFFGIYISVWGLSIPGILPGFWTAVFITAGANVFIQLLNARSSSLVAGEVSLTAPLQALTPGLITIVALTLGEFPGKIGVAGIVLMSCGSFVLLSELRPAGAARWYDSFKPFRVLGTIFRWTYLSETEKDKAKVVIMSIGSACLGTIGLLFDGLFTRRGVNLQGLTLGSMVLTGALCMVYCYWFLVRPDRNSASIAKSSGRLMIGSLIGGAIWVALIYLINPAFSVEYVAYVGTLKRFSIPMSALLGWWFFSEQNIKRRLWAAGLVTLGVILLSQDNLPARIS